MSSAPLAKWLTVADFLRHCQQLSLVLRILRHWSLWTVSSEGSGPLNSKGSEYECGTRVAKDQIKFVGGVDYFMDDDKQCCNLHFSSVALTGLCTLEYKIFHKSICVITEAPCQATNHIGQNPENWEACPSVLSSISHIETIKAR